MRGRRANRGQKLFPLKIRFIVNLRSGRAARRFAAIREFAARQGATVAVTERTRHASELARRAVEEGCDLVVAVGGDGTMNEIACTLVDTPTTLGLIPCGSGDGLGRHLRIHGSMSHALGVLQHGRVRLIDTGYADGHPFFTAAGIGFEAEIARRFNTLKKRGFLRYVSTAARAYYGWRSQHYTLEQAGVREPLHAFTLAVTNSDQYGNNARIAPEARIDDGLLDLCAVPPVSFWNALPLAAHLFHGTIGRVSGVQLRRSNRFIVEREFPGPLHTDGELHEAGTRIEFTVRPQSLRVLCPAQAAQLS